MYLLENSQKIDFEKVYLKYADDIIITSIVTVRFNSCIGSIWTLRKLALRVTYYLRNDNFDRTANNAEKWFTKEIIGERK